MENKLNETISILEKLVSFPTISGTSTREINKFIEEYLSQHGLEPVLSYDEDGERSNIFVTIGPKIDGGVLFNGHTDVVPVEGQKWSTDPFNLTRIDDRLYGRGAVDMKGFLACALASLPTFLSANLIRPIHLAFSYDEETGGFGMPVLLNSMANNEFQPNVVIVGEPTEMKIITGHKGSYEMRTEISGYEVHSSNPLLGINAISVAMKLISKIEEINNHLQKCDGVMIGRSVYQNPYSLVEIEQDIFKTQINPSREEVAAKLLEYLEKEVKLGTKVNHIMRHTVGLYHGQVGSKEWKRYLSDNMMARDSDFQKAKHIMTIVQNNEKANQVSS